jgi:hypothetical protein
MKPSSLKPAMRPGCPLFTLLFNIVIEFLARIVTQGERKKRDPNREGRSQTILICRSYCLMPERRILPKADRKTNGIQ